MIEWIDFFTTSVTFNVRNRENYGTTIGVVVSMVNVLMLGLLIYSFGEDFFLRTNPRYMQQTIYPERYNNYTVNNKNFSFAFRIEDLNAILIDRPELVYIDFRYFHYEIKDGSWVLIESKSMDFDKCKKTDLGIESEYDKMNFKNWYCPKINNIEVGGNWDESYIKFFRVFVYKCSEGSENHHTGQKCGNKEEFNKINTERLFFSTFYQKYFIDPGNYLSPLNVMYSTTFNMIDTFQMKRNLYYFKYGTISTDFGWIFKSLQHEYGFTINHIFSDSMSIALLPEKDKNMIFESGIYFTRETELYSRSFAKIQDLAATVGGVVKMFMLVSGIIVSFYNKRCLKFEIMNQCYDLNRNFKKTEIKSPVNSSSNINFFSNNQNILNNNFTNVNNILKNPTVRSKAESVVNENFPHEKKDAVKKFKKFKNHLWIFPWNRHFKSFKIMNENLNLKLDVFEYLSIGDDVRKIKELFMDEIQHKTLTIMKKDPPEILFMTKQDLNKTVFSSKNYLGSIFRENNSNIKQATGNDKHLKIMSNLIKENY